MEETITNSPEIIKEIVNEPSFIKQNSDKSLYSHIYTDFNNSANLYYNSENLEETVNECNKYSPKNLEETISESTFEHFHPWSSFYIPPHQYNLDYKNIVPIQQSSGNLKLKNKTVVELKDICRKKQISGYSALTKNKIILLILNNMTIPELKKMCKKDGIHNYSSLNKDELINKMMFGN